MFVTEMMKTDLVAITPETSLAEAKELMEKQGAMVSSNRSKSLKGRLMTY